MKFQILSLHLVALLLAPSAFSLTVPSSTCVNKHFHNPSSSLFPKRKTPSFQALTASSAAITPPTSDDDYSKGVFTFKTKYGYLNPFAIYHGVTSILLGIPWFIALNICQLFYKLTNNKFDKLRVMPVYASMIWGSLLLKLTRSMPHVEGREILEKFYKEDRAAMFVANHSSFMDIPFVGTSIGWRNYKFISKAELGKVPILGRSIKVGGNVMLDRTNRRSQLMTLKNGIQWLKDGVHLVTFPEGTRSKTGRMLPFKNGAFKMAHKCESPVVPISIQHANIVNPTTWMFPRRPSRGVCKVIVHEPVESKGISEAELADKVRAAIVSGLTEDQKPLD